jgi:uncharacterized membrane protein YcaP (DUF421 family)
MDPLRIALRAVFMFIVTMALIRASGKRTIRQTDMSSFIVALIIGDLFDDFVWAEVSAAEFIVAVGTVATTHMIAGWINASSGMREWLRAARRG